MFPAAATITTSFPAAFRMAWASAGSGLQPTNPRLMFTTRAFCDTAQFRPAAMDAVSANSRPASVMPNTFTGSTFCGRHVIPVMPRPLLPAAPTMPALLVPCPAYGPVISEGSASSP